MNIITRTVELTGTNRAIGGQLMRDCGEQIISFMKSGEELSKADMNEITDLLDQWCPGRHCVLCLRIVLL